MKDIPLLLLTGYLGSGKTTLVNRILRNEDGIRFAVIVNDIGEVNIDAELIRKGGLMGEKDDSLVALQNGCICCTLRTDLIEQILEIMKMQCFDYIVIEASGICDPEPIARTISSIPKFGGAYTQYGTCRLDNIVTVVDALRMQSEFACGENISQKNLEEDDIENLLISQIEFCNTILLNKVSEVSAVELERIRTIIRTLQPKAEIIECDYADVSLDRIINTGKFSFGKVATSAGWIQYIGQDMEETHHAGCKCGCHHHHHHHHGEGEAAAYGIETFVYYRRPAFDLSLFDHFVASKWPSNIIRAKGVCYFSNYKNMSYVFEQAGRQKNLSESGLWYATAPEEEIARRLKEEPDLMRDWDPVYGDRMQKIVFIGQNIDREQLIAELDRCLEPSAGTK